MKSTIQVTEDFMDRREDVARIGRVYPAGSAFRELTEYDHLPAPDLAPKRGVWGERIAKLILALFVILLAYLACLAI